MLYLTYTLSLRASLQVFHLITNENQQLNNANITIHQVKSQIKY